MKQKIISFVLILLIITGCRTYYRKNLQFQEYLMEGRLEKAKEVLEDDEKAKTGKNRLLYYLNNGWVNWMTDDYKKSNENFLQADRIIEDHQKNYGNEALALILNPTVKPYRAEDFEKVFVNYFKALNYLSLNDKEAALVEVRRMNIVLNELNDKYKDHKNRYQDDAFAHVIMGMIYESNKDYNNAFIAYRNGYEAYKNLYRETFGVDAPKQLKHDLIRSAYKTGFFEEARQYEKEFAITYDKSKDPEAELVFIWQNGFGPVKDEWSINFAVVKGKGGYVNFVNEELGMSFPFYIGDKTDEEKSAFGDLSVLRVAFPKYVERTPVFRSATIKNGNSTFELELAENVNAIAFKTLKDRMLRELANSLLRLGAKKAMEYAARKENKDLGAVVSIVNAVTEKADTRNWQTLPHSIYYTRVPLKAGKQEVILEMHGGGSSNSQTFTFDVQKDRTYFQSFQSLETLPPGVK